MPGVYLLRKICVTENNLALHQKPNAGLLLVLLPAASNRKIFAALARRKRLRRMYSWTRAPFGGIAATKFK
jgi:hypothetical protein